MTQVDVMESRLVCNRERSINRLILQVYLHPTNVQKCASLGATDGNGSQYVKKNNSTITITYFVKTAPAAMLHYYAGCWGAACVLCAVFHLLVKSFKKLVAD